MKKAFVYILCLLSTVSCIWDPTVDFLTEGNWAPEVRESLVKMMIRTGKGSYAVFDFDKTSIVHDISQALWVYQIEHLRYADAPDHNFLDGIPSPEDEMPGTGLSYATMGKVL